MSAIEYSELTANEIERCYQQFLRQNGMSPSEDRRAMIMDPPKITLRDVSLDRPNRWYGKGIYESMITRPTPDHILRTVHYLNRWLRWLNFGIVY